MPKITKPASAVPTPQIILRYPPNHDDCISISSNDYLDLEPQEYLNDNIIDFYIKYLTLEKISEEDRNRIHIFGSFFYPFYSSQQRGKKETEEEKYNRVAECYKEVKLFGKDFIFVPINVKQEHWILAVICYPCLVDQTKHDKQSPKQSCILIFDSFGKKRPVVVRKLRSYLRQRYDAEHGGKICDFDSTNMPECYVDVPLQYNLYDCGIFVLEYVENFLLNPIKDFHTPIKGLEKWFGQDVIQGKRQFLKDLIQSLTKRCEPVKMPLDFNSNTMNDVGIDDEGPSKQEPRYNLRNRIKLLNKD